MIVACISTYKDGHLLAGCIDSAASLDAVLVCDGPWGEGAGKATPRDVVTPYGVHVYREGAWASDAAKRSYMLAMAKAFHKGFVANTVPQGDEPLWVLWLDGDEVLLWGNYLADMAAAAEEETGAGGFPLRLVELDGSVVECRGKVIRADAVKRYLHSSYQIETHTGMVVALPNVPICGAGGIPVGYNPGQQPMSPEEQNTWLAKCRPPLQGEPHLLHRSALRSSRRGVVRGHEAEAEWFEEHGGVT